MTAPRAHMALTCPNRLADGQGRGLPSQDAPARGFARSAGSRQSAFPWRVAMVLAVLACLAGCGGYYKGNLALNRGDHAEGARLLEQSVANHPDWANARIDLGRAYLYLGRDEEAREQLTLAAEMDPSAWRSTYYLAVTDILAGRGWQGLERFAESTYPLELDMKRDIVNMTATLARLGLPRREFLDAARRVLNEADRRQKMRDIRLGGD